MALMMPDTAWISHRYDIVDIMIALRMTSKLEWVVSSITKGHLVARVSDRVL